MSLADKFGLGPTRSEVKEDEHWIITVQPPAHLKLPPQKVRLTEDQHQRYQTWLQTGVLIQDILDDLSPDDAEILQSGIGPEDWNRMFKEEE